MTETCSWEGGGGKRHIEDISLKSGQQNVSFYRIYAKYNYTIELNTEINLTGIRLCEAVVTIITIIDCTVLRGK